jgi:hypothetical protein
MILDFYVRVILDVVDNHQEVLLFAAGPDAGDVDRSTDSIAVAVSVPIPVAIAVSVAVAIPVSVAVSGSVSVPVSVFGSVPVAVSSSIAGVTVSGITVRPIPVITVTGTTCECDDTYTDTTEDGSSGYVAVAIMHGYQNILFPST